MFKNYMREKRRVEDTEPREKEKEKNKRGFVTNEILIKFENMNTIIMLLKCLIFWNSSYDKEHSECFPREGDRRTRITSGNIYYKSKLTYYLNNSTCTWELQYLKQFTK